MVAGTFARLAHGGDRTNKQERNSTLAINEAADLFNISKDTVKDARTVLGSERPEVIAKVSRGAEAGPRCSQTNWPESSDRTATAAPMGTTQPAALCHRHEIGTKEFCVNNNAHGNEQANPITLNSYGYISRTGHQKEKR
jgi:hypothetical protein